MWLAKTSLSKKLLSIMFFVSAFLKKLVLNTINARTFMEFKMKKVILGVSMSVMLSPIAIAQQDVGFEGTAEQLYSQYKDNSVAFNRKVKGKEMVVTGELREIKEDENGNIVLQMPGSEMISWIDIRMNKDQEDKVLELKTGQKATVSCKKIQKVFELEMSDCVMKESAASSNTQATKIDNEFMTAVLNSDVAVGDVKDISREETPVQGFKQRFEFSIPEVAPKGGQMFICDEKKDCDPIFAYYDALKGLAGPFLYQSPKGLVVLQLNSGLKEETAKKLEKAISEF